MKKISYLLLACISFWSLPCAAYSYSSSNTQEYTNDDLERGCDIDDEVTYLRLGAALLPDGSGVTFAPALGVGRRWELNDGAVDISFNWASAEKQGKTGRSSYYSLPKALYLFFADPYHADSFYYGGGLSLGGIKKGGDDFQGILAEFALGYEFHRHSSVRSIIEVDISQAMVGFSKEGGLPAPVLMFSFILGF